MLSICREILERNFVFHVITVLHNRLLGQNNQILAHFNQFEKPELLGQIWYNGKMPIKKIIIVLWSALLVFTLFFMFKPQTTNADQLDDINKQLADLNADLNKSIAATKPVESELKSMQAQIVSIKSQVAGIEVDIAQNKRSIDTGYKNLEEKEKIISLTIRDFYIKSYNDSPLLVLLSLDNATDVTQALAYQHAKTKQDKSIITNIALSITDLEKKKADLIEEQKFLVSAKSSLDE